MVKGCEFFGGVELVLCGRSKNSSILLVAYIVCAIAADFRNATFKENTVFIVLVPVTSFAVQTCSLKSCIVSKFELSVSVSENTEVNTSRRPSAAIQTVQVLYSLCLIFMVYVVEVSLFSNQTRVVR